MALKLTCISIPARSARIRSATAAFAAVAICLGVGGVVAGCARGVATTTIRPNGSWVRTVAYHGAKATADAETAGGGASIQMPGSLGSSVRDAFVLPSGAGWKITHEDTKDEAVVKAERTMQPGENVHGDITCKGSGGKPAPVASNVVMVQTLSPGVFRYSETFHWIGLAPKGLTPDADMLAAFKKALPTGLATDANARDLATQSIHDLWSVMFGPGDPLISQISALLTEPELVERRVQQRIGATLEQHIAAKFGDKVTPEQCRAISASIIHNSLFNLTDQTKKAGPGGDPSAKSDDPPPSASLFIEVKLPGRVTATNGERDDVNGSVFWALYPEAAALGDVTLTATCDTNAAKTP